MAVITLREAKRRIDPFIGQLRTNINSVQSTRFKVLYNGRKNLDVSFLAKIIHRCRETGLLVADGEGKLFPKKRQNSPKFPNGKNKKNHSGLQSPLETSMEMSICSQIGKTLQNELLHYRITKLQRGITKDVQEFYHYQIE